MRFIEFGWNALLLEIPDNMMFVSEGGNAQSSGYIRLESEEALLEFNWETTKPDKIKPLIDVVESRIKSIEKIRKSKIPIKRRVSTIISGHSALYLSLKTDVNESVYAWYCDKSNRTFICHVVFNPKVSSPYRIRKRIIDSIRCHSEEFNVWSALAFRFEAPNTFILTDRKLTVRESYLLLVDREVKPFTERRREILFEYFPMANILFEDSYRDPDRWMRESHLKSLRKRYKGLKFESSEPRRVRGHKGVIKHGKGSRGLTTRIKSLYTNLTWYCSNLNRIYSVTVSSHLVKPFFLKREENIEEFRRIADKVFSSIKCH